MASNFPKLPGYVVTHDPTIVSHKKVSHVKLNQIRNGQNVEVPLYALPRPLATNFRPEKTDASKSLSQNHYPNHLGSDINEQFEPTFVKLDKQVRRWRRLNIFDSNYNIGPPLLRLLQRKRRRKPSRKLQNSSFEHLLLPWGQINHDHRAQISKFWCSTRCLPQTPDGPQSRRNESIHATRLCCRTWHRNFRKTDSNFRLRSVH